MNQCMIILKNADVNQLLDLVKVLGVLTKSNEQIESDSDPMSLEENQIGIAQIGDWGVLVSGCYLFLEKEATPILTSFSDNTKVFFVLTESTSAGLWFEYHVNGELIRKWVEVESEVAVNFGEALPQEPGNFFTSEPDEEGDRDEWKLFDLCEKVTQVSTEKLFNNTYEIYN